jgi:hypothetical protein
MAGISDSLTGSNPGGFQPSSPLGSLGPIMSLLRLGQNSPTGLPNAPTSVSAAAPGRIGLGNTTVGYQTPGGGVWFGTPSNPLTMGPSAPNSGGLPPIGAASGNSQTQGPGQPAGWFPGQGQGFTFFGQSTPTQVGTNQFVWGNPNVPGMTPSNATTTQTNTLQNIMQMLSSLQNQYQQLQNQYSGLNTQYGNLQNQYNSLNTQNVNSKNAFNQYNNPYPNYPSNYPGIYPDNSGGA